MTTLYGDRDPMQQDRFGNHYSKHVSAMTAEGLHSKSRIAAELAHRDIRIKELEYQLGQMKISLEHKTTLLTSCETALEERDAKAT